MPLEYPNLLTLASTVLDGVHHITPPSGPFFQELDCPTKQEGANTERCRLRKALGAYAPNADLVGTDTIPTAVGISTMEDRPQGCVCCTPSYTVLGAAPAGPWGRRTWDVQNRSDSDRASASMDAVSSADELLSLYFQQAFFHSGDALLASPVL